VLLAGSEVEEAKGYIDAAENGKLYPEEKKLIEEAKTKLIAASTTPVPVDSPSPSATPPL